MYENPFLSFQHQLPCYQLSLKNVANIIFCFVSHLTRLLDSTVCPDRSIIGKGSKALLQLFKNLVSNQTVTEYSVVG